jgi:predicted kinase
MKKNIIAVIGKVAAGKDFFADNVYPKVIKIDVGTIVRTLLKETKRIHNKQLDKAIIQELYRQISLAGNESVIITGIRQVSIYQWLQEYSEIHYSLTTYYLECPLSVLKQRWSKRASEKDFGITFEDVVERDGELGLNELEDYILNLSTTIKINTNINAKDAIQTIEKWKATTVDNRNSTRRL